MSRDFGTEMSRREAMAALGGLAWSLHCGARLAVAQEGKGAFKGIALQLYTMREPAKQDLAGTLKKVREMGWEYVQWSGMPDLPAAEIRAALDAAGLKAVACHCGVEPFETDFDNQVAFWKTVGVSDVGPGGMMGDCRESLEAWIKGAKRLDVVGAKLREQGLRLNYHNHDSEFEKYPEDPRAKLDILRDETAPGNLHFELDLAWVQVGGADPAATMLQYKNRCPMIHAKDCLAKRLLGRRVQFMPLGEGVLDWPVIFKAGREAGVEWYIYEQDNADRDIFECAKISFEFLSKNLMG